jgi:hypothetical protein
VFLVVSEVSGGESEVGMCIPASFAFFLPPMGRVLSTAHLNVYHEARCCNAFPSLGRQG